MKLIIIPEQVPCCQTRLRVENDSNESICEIIKEILEDQKHSIKSVNIYERRSRKIEKNLKIAKIVFAQQTIPNSVKIGNKKIPIREEYPKPMQCRVCLKYEHTARRCRSLATQRCFKCGSIDHTSDNCGNSFKCFNCSGSHHAFARECIFYKYHQEALTRSRRYDITIKEAKEDMKEEGL